MPQRENNGDRFKRLRRAASRRQFIATVLAASVGGMAGCNSGGGGDGGDTDTDGGDGGSTPTATPGMGPTDTPGDGTDESTPTDTESATPTGDPQATTINHYMATNPAQSNANRYSPNSAINNSGVGWMFEMTLPYQEGQSRFYTSNHTWDIPDLGEVEVMTWLENYRIEAPFDWWETYDDRTMYWDGTNMDAEARKLHEQIAYYAEGAGDFSPGSPNFEQVSDWEMHLWNDKGEAEGGTAAPQNQFSIQSNVGMYEPPPHPNLTGPWAESAMEADTQEEVNSIYSDDIQGYVLTYNEMAENGYGSGLYMADGADAVTDQGVRLTARDGSGDLEAHPNYRDQTVDEIFLRVAGVERRNTFLNQGEIDLDMAVIEEQSGPVNRETLPGRVQQLSTFPATAMNGFPFNWDGDLGNLWVRRAIIEAVDWVSIAANAHGPNSFFLTQHHTGLLDAMAERWFDSEFLDNLIDWSNRADTETGEEYMEKAGYSKQGGNWVSPEGEPAEILLKASPGYGQLYELSCQALQQQLNNFGIDANYQGLSTSAVNTARDNMSYDALYWWNNMRNPWEAYTSSTGWWNPKIVERDPDFPNSHDGWSDTPNGLSPDPEDVTNAEGEVVDPADTHDLRGMPIEVDLPTQVGDMSAPTIAGKEPNLDGVTDSRTVNLMELLIEFHTDPDIGAERVTELLETFAWFYNYYLPDFWSVQGAGGVIGNVRDFNFTERGHNSYAASVRTGGFSDQYQSHSGLVRKKYNDEFESP